MTRPRTALTFLTFTCLLAPLVAQGPYTIRRLPGTGALQFGRAQGIDDQANIVGELLDGGGVEQAVLWVDGVPQALPIHAGGSRGSGWTISSNGLLGGNAGNGTTTNVGTIWQPAPLGGFTLLDMGVAPGDIFSQVYSINGNGASCGYTDDGIVFRPCAWIIDADVGNPVLLPIPAGFFAGDAYAIDNSNLIAGSVATFGVEAPTTWTPSGAGFTATLLPTLGSGGRAVDIDSSGVVHGFALSAATGNDHVVTWSGGTITDLGGLPGQDCWTAASNNGQDVVGTVRTFSSPAYVGFVRQAGGAITDLNSVLPASSAWSIRRANDINDDGMIVGEGVLGGFIEPFVMIPVSMSHAAPTPGIAGVNNQFTVTGATPMQMVYYFFSLSPGETTFPGCLEGLDMASGVSFGMQAADGAGVAKLNFPVPPALSGIPLFLQAYDWSACHTSNLLPFTFL